MTAALGSISASGTALNSYNSSEARWRRYRGEWGRVGAGQGTMPMTSYRSRKVCCRYRNRWLNCYLAGLPRGSVAVLTGARSLPLSMAAAVTAAGGHVCHRRPSGRRAAGRHGDGGGLSRLAVVPDPGADPVEVAAVLLDGMDLVVLGCGRTGGDAEPGTGR